MMSIYVISYFSMENDRYLSVINSQLNHLQEIAVRGMPISRAGPDGAVHSSIPAVKILDVSDTLLSSWSEIARITKQLPQLEILYVRYLPVYFLSFSFSILAEVFIGCYIFFRVVSPSVD